MPKVGNVSYTSNKIIGKGGFGVVYEGFLDENPIRKVAVKCILKVNVDLSVMKEEAQLMLKANNHANILQFICDKENSDFM